MTHRSTTVPEVALQQLCYTSYMDLNWILCFSRCTEPQTVLGKGAATMICHPSTDRLLYVMTVQIFLHQVSHKHKDGCISVAAEGHTVKSFAFLVK